MDFFKKFFSSKSKNYQDIHESEADTNIDNMSLDEQFVYRYIQKGGKFFYPDDMDDFKRQLLQLLQYLDIPEFAVMERGYFHFLQKLKIPVTDQIKNAEVLLGGCEFLLAEEGAIMTTATHTGEYRHNELPHKRVIIAMTNQIIPDKTQALIKINNKYDKPPANIQTMSIFAKPTDSLSSGQWFETYLFLIEN